MLNLSFVFIPPNTQVFQSNYSSQLVLDFSRTVFDIDGFEQVVFSIRFMGLFTKERITFRKPFRVVILTLSWFESLILTFVNAKFFHIRLWKARKKKAFWIMIRLESLILRTCERKALTDRDSCVCTRKYARNPLAIVLSLQLAIACQFTRWSHAWLKGSISAVGTKYYFAVRRSCSWLGWRLQCLWTHVAQITNRIRKRIVIQNGFRNVIHSFVNRPKDAVKIPFVVHI